MRVELVIDLELVDAAGELSDDALDAWSWSVERQLEELELVRRAEITTASFDRSVSS